MTLIIKCFLILLIPLSSISYTTSSVCIYISYFSIRNMPWLSSTSCWAISFVTIDPIWFSTSVSPAPRTSVPSALPPDIPGDSGAVGLTGGGWIISSILALRTLPSFLLFPMFPERLRVPVLPRPVGLRSCPVLAFISSTCCTVFLTERPVRALKILIISNLKKKITLRIRQKMQIPRHT